MMPGITIQSGFSLANPPAIRGVSSVADDHFSNALFQKPKTSARNDVADKRPESDAKTDSADVGKAGRTVDGTSDKLSQTKGTDDEQAAIDDDEAEKKDKGDKESSVLSPQMTAERALAQHWPASTAKDGASTGNGASGGACQVATALPAGQSADDAASGGKATPTGETGSSPVTDPTSAPVTMTKAGSQAHGATIRLVAAASGEPKTAPNGKVDASAPIPADGQPVADPGLKGVSVSAASSTEPANASAAFLARIAAMHHDGGSPLTAQGAGNAPSGATQASANEPSGQSSPIASSQGSANADTNPDGQNDGGGKASNGAQQGVLLSSTVAASDAASAPLPTAQMVPASSSAASVAGALAQDGRLARYAEGAAAALAAGTPVNTLPVQSLRIQLRPVELGAVTANLKYAGSQLTIDIQVETSDAQRRLSNDSSDIVKSLQSLGLQVDKITVRQIQAPAQAQAQGQGQPAARDGSAGGFAGQGNTPFSMSGQSERQAGGHRQGTENRHEDGSEGGIGTVRQTADPLARRGVFI